MRSKVRTSISTLIRVSHLLVSIVIGLISTLSVYFIYQNGQQSSLQQMQSLAIKIDSMLESSIHELDGKAQLDDLVTITQQELAKENRALYAVLNADGSTSANPRASQLPGQAADSPEVALAMRKAIGQSIRPDANGQVMIYTATAIDEDRHRYGILVVATPFQQIMEPTYQMMRVATIVMLTILALVIITGWLIGKSISDSFSQLYSAAIQLREGDLKARAQEAGPVEVVHLARALNEMASRLEFNLGSLQAFVENASHELRTPLTSMKLQVGALRGGAVEEPEIAERFLGQIEAEIDHLVRMVNDMLDLSHIASRRPSHKTNDPIQLTDLAQEVQAFWETRSRQAGIALELFTPPSLPQVTGDAYQLRRLFDHLLDNAIKNTPPGGMIHISLQRCCLSENWVRIEVKDTGRGIPEVHLPYLFDHFYRVLPQNQNEKSDGSGLGLALARSIVVSHGGKIGVNSQPGQGSTFWIELPGE